MTGIYKIQSIVKPDRFYIGGAINTEKSWEDHLSLLRLNKHYSTRLQFHFNKYGEDDLQLFVIFECLKMDLPVKEKHFINRLKPYFNVRNRNSNPA